MPMPKTMTPRVVRTRMQMKKATGAKFYQLCRHFVFTSCPVLMTLTTMKTILLSFYVSLKKSSVNVPRRKLDRSRSSLQQMLLPEKLRLPPEILFSIWQLLWDSKRPTV
jgi:hypothetical protein